MKKQKESKKTKMKKYSLIFVSVIIALMIMISWYFVMISFQERKRVSENDFTTISSDKFQTSYYDSIHDIDVIELKMYQEDILNYKIHNRISYRTYNKYENLLFDRDSWRIPRKRNREATRTIFMLGSNTRDTTNQYRSMYILYSKSLTETKAIEILQECFSCNKLLIKDEVEGIAKTYNFVGKQHMKHL